MRAVPLVVLLLGTVGMLPACWAQQVNLLDVGNRSQLLLDPSIVFESEHVSFTPHPGVKHPANPIVTADQPWEGTYVSAFAGSVLYDAAQRRFQMWYTCDDSPTWFDARGICYAVSRDGLTWEKPTVATRKSKNGRPHNSLLAVDCPSVMFDPRDADATRRYKMICFDVDRGYLAMTSPDGLSWTEQSPRPIVPISYVDDVVSAFHDSKTGEFVAMPKMISPVFGRLRRTIYLSTSADFRNWSKPELAFAADRRDDLGTLARVERARPLLSYPDNMNVLRTEFYGAGAYVAESCTIGFPWVFSINTNIPGKGNQEGPIEVQLAVSRDRESWQRPFRTPIVPLGKAGEWDSGMILTASQAIDVGNEVWLYYGGSNYTHGAPHLYEPPPARGDGKNAKYGGAIGLATWRRDRFVSADGPASGGTLTTVPLRFAGKRLEINAATKGQGEVRVEILDAAGKPIDGFAISSPIAGDSMRHVVAIPGQNDLSKLAGKPISLRFHMRNAELYAFAFRE